jgi:hypothetical protein
MSPTGSRHRRVQNTCREALARHEAETGVFPRDLTLFQVSIGSLAPNDDQILNHLCSPITDSVARQRAVQLERTCVQ